MNICFGPKVTVFSGPKNALKVLIKLTLQCQHKWLQLSSWSYAKYIYKLIINKGNHVKKIITSMLLIASFHLLGCASVPMASADIDKEKKTFAAPSEGNAGLYVYRNSSFGGALKKTIRIDGNIIGESATNTYFYKEISPGSHVISTESEFSDNQISIDFQKGINYFVRQYIKFGVL